MSERYELPATIPEGGRNDELFKYACSLQAKGVPDEELRREVADANAERCTPPLPDSEVAATCDSVTRKYPKGDAARPLPVPRPREVAALAIDPAEKVTDESFSRLFAQYARGLLAWCVEWRTWMLYDGVRWVPDRDVDWAPKKVTACAKYMLALVWKRPDVGEGARRSFCKGVERYLSQPRAEIALRAARPFLAVHARDFDGERTRHLLNTPTCTLDLGGDEIVKRPHDPADMITKVTGARWDPKADCKRISDFLTGVDVTGDKAAYLQRELSRSLDADTSRQRMYVLQGPTRGGKSTLMGAVTAALGDYAGGAKPETLARQSGVDSGRASPDVAHMRGCRIIVIPEPERGLTLNVSLIKQMTGGDTITARALYQNSEEFRLQGTMWMVANKLPGVNDMTLFTGDRVRVITFPRHLAEGERDFGLAEEMRSEDGMAAMLKWLAAGWENRRADPDAPDPAEVRADTKAWEEEADNVGNFINERMYRAADQTQGVTLSEVYPEYMAWCSDSGVAQLGKRRLKQDLEARGMLVAKARIGGKSGQSNVLPGWGLRRR